MSFSRAEGPPAGLRARPEPAEGTPRTAPAAWRMLGFGVRCGSAARDSPRQGSAQVSRAPGRCIAAGRRVAHPLFLIPLPLGGEDQGEGGTHRASGVEGRGGRTAQAESKGGGDAPRKRSRRQRGDAPRGSRWRQRPPLTLPSPPKGRGKEERPPGILVLRSRWPACADAASRSLRVDSSLRRLRSA